MKLPISDSQGNRLGEYEIDDALLTHEKGRQALHHAVVAYRAHQRRGTASTLSKGEVAGSNRKPWRQKGLGRARAGSIRSPLWRGGGVAFGPKPRRDERKQNKKAARLAFRRAFSEKVATGGVLVLDKLELEEPKTRRFVAVLDQLKLVDNVLVILDGHDPNVERASRNVPGVHVTTARRVNAYELLRYPQVLVSRAAMETIQGRLKAGERKAA